jgi:hypothetical protein
MIGSILTAVLPKALDVIDDLVPDKDAAAKAKQEIEARLVEATLATNIETIKTNQAEAASRHWFVASWRPAIGWSCAIGIFWMAIGQPIANYGLALNGMDTTNLPQLPTDILLELTFAMLGMSGLRTFEKLKGVTK